MNRYIVTKQYIGIRAQRILETIEANSEEEVKEIIKIRYPSSSGEKFEIKQISNRSSNEISG